MTVCNSPRQKQKKKQRFKDRSAEMPRLMRMGARCHWCNQGVTRVADIPPCERVTPAWGYIGRRGGPVQLMASIDHLREIGDRQHVVLACVPCNAARAVLSESEFADFVEMQKGGRLKP